MAVGGRAVDLLHTFAAAARRRPSGLEESSFNYFCTSSGGKVEAVARQSLVDEHWSYGIPPAVRNHTMGIVLYRVRSIQSKNKRSIVERPRGTLLLLSFVVSQGTLFGPSWWQLGRLS